jgi:RecA/RadA recombinase
MSFLKNALKATKNEYAGTADAGIIGDFEEYLDTGSYALNAYISASIYGGFPKGKVTALAAEPSSGKTMVLLTTAAEFLIANPTALVFYFESESAITTEMLQAKAIPLDRFVVLPVVTIEEFRTQAVKILDEYMSESEKDRPPIFFCLDSLGMLSSAKELADITDGKDTRDMTKSQLIKGAFRVITLKLGAAKVPMAVNVHVYKEQGGGPYAQWIVSGGNGTIYAASTILHLGKRKAQDSQKNQYGVDIRTRVLKSRFTRENLVGSFLLHFEKGMDRYYGLSDIALEAGIFRKIANKIAVSDDVAVFESELIKNPTKYYTKDILDKIDAWTRENFVYGGGEEEETTE